MLLERNNFFMRLFYFYLPLNISNLNSLDSDWTYILTSNCEDYPKFKSAYYFAFIQDYEW